MAAGLRDPEALLAAWEAGLQAPGLQRGAAVVGDAGELPLGQVAARAARAYAEAFGAVAETVVACRECGAVVELLLAVNEWPETPAEVPVVLGAGTAVVRAPTGSDLAAAAADPDPRGLLIRRCVGAQVAPEDEAAVAQAFEVLAGPAVPEVRTSCPGCSSELVAVVDVAGLLWQQVERSAARLLGEVADLAAAYGWSEAEVLALSPARRLAYLQLAPR